MASNRPCIIKLAGLALLAVLAFAPNAVAAGAQYLIVSAEPASGEFEPGRVLAPGDTLVVPEGTVVTLLGEDGSINAIPGPAEVEVTDEAVKTDSRSSADPDANRSTLSKIAGLLAGERDRAESLGVSRGFADRSNLAGLDDPWTVSVHESGPGCVRDGEVVLARKDAANAIGLSFRIGDREPVADIVWPSGEAKFKLDTTVLPTEREILVDADKDFAKIALNLKPDAVNLKNPLDVMGWMIDSGCQRQAVAFIKALARTNQ
jgi:hypothetical protein